MKRAPLAVASWLAAIGACGGSRAAGVTGGAPARGGTIAIAGTAGAAGTGGSAGAPGTAGSAGASGADGVVGCTFAVTASLSSAIPTVGIVTFTTDLPGITSAQIRFGLGSTGPTMTAPVDLNRAGHRTLLLGMKGSSTYVFRIVAASAAGSCASEDHMLTTGAVPDDIPRLTATIVNAAAHVRGFIVTSDGLGSLPYGGRTAMAYIIDSDGDPVWWANSPGAPTRAHMSWDGGDMYMLSVNVANMGGNVTRVSMEGANAENNLSGISGAHHDFTVIPGGIAAVVWNTSGMDAPNALVERTTNGTLTMVVADLGALYNAERDKFHPNAIHYTPWDDSYTIGDLNPHLFVKVTRKGELVWQLGGSDPKDPRKFFTGVPLWSGNHGHQLLADGTFVFFNNAAASGSLARVLKIDTATMTATDVLSYDGEVVSGTLGDVQRLANGNILVTYSGAGQIHEIDASGRLVALFQATGSRSQLGYAAFRESLYGPPPY